MNMAESKKLVKSRKVRSFRLIDFYVYDEKPGQNMEEEEQKTRSSYTPPKFIIQMFGINEKGETFSIFLNDYYPFFYVLVPDSWKKDNCEDLCKDIRAKLGQGITTESVITDAEIVEYNKLYGFTAGKKSKFVKLTFPNMMCMSRVRNLWYTKDFQNMVDGQPTRKLQPFQSQGAKLFLYESKLPPLLRYFHIHNISPSGWVFVPIDSVQVPVHDTIRILNEYYRIKAYTDTIKKDSNIFVIDDTISQNRIISRGFKAKLTEKTIYVKEYYAQKAKFGIYYGIRGDFSQENGLEVLSPGILLNAKNKALIGLNININKNYNISYSGSIYLPIGKK